MNSQPIPAKADGHPVWEQLDRHLDAMGTPAVLLVLPPFAGIDRPSLGLHTLQACAAARGHDVRVLYANILFAQILGEVKYESLCYAPTSDLLGERIFAVAAFGTSYPGHGVQGQANLRTALRMSDPVNEEELEELQRLACDFVQLLSKALAGRNLAFVGCNSTFEQTCAAVAILSSLKSLQPEITTLMGGANCEGEMARGVLSLSSAIDYVFSGESESSFLSFLDLVRSGDQPERGVIDGTPCNNLDVIPNVNYSDYYAQLSNLGQSDFLHRTGSIWLPYETSRGCWWGQKHHCTFCGINGGGMAFRHKSPEAVLDQLPALLKNHPTKKVLMVDNIMPLTYFETLLPRLVQLNLGMHAFYEQKANLTIKRVKLLKDAGVAVIQPGIEALSTDLLRLMKKGVSASQNLALLRYARSVDVSVNWNLLYAFPRDEEAHYEQTLEILPSITHLSPPSGACHLSIDRFSPYFDHALDYDVRNLRPMDAYLSIFPHSVDTSKIAYHFVADYDCATRRDPTIAARIKELIASWRAMWSQSDRKAPVLAIEQISPCTFILCDTRSQIATEHRFLFISEDQARVALAGMSRDASDGLREWAIVEARVAVELDDRVIPLATARPELIEAFEAEAGTRRNQAVPIEVAD
jgi:ribosomal peptide maturation radical SAM protein 1